MERPHFFIPGTPTVSDHMDFFTDASQRVDWSMPIKELFSILVSAAIWGESWSNMRIVVGCDNEPTVKAINKGYSNKPVLSDMLRNLMLYCMKFNFSLKARHVPRLRNINADILSHLQVRKFLERNPEAESVPVLIPDSLPWDCSTL